MKAEEAKPRALLARARMRPACHDRKSIDSTNNCTRNNLSGRPIITLKVGGNDLDCFIDTGSAASLIKNTTLRLLKFASRARKARPLVGVTGALLDTGGKGFGGQNIPKAESCT